MARGATRHHREPLRRRIPPGAPSELIGKAEFDRRLLLPGWLAVADREATPRRSGGGVTRWLVASAASLVVLAGGIAMGAPGDEMTAPARPGSSSDTGEVWLTNLPEVDDYGGWSRQPMVVSGQRHSVALSTSPCWLNDDFTATFVVSRRYSQLDAHVGIADDSPVGLPLDFAVLIDGEEIFTTSAGLGELLPVSVDIASATQVTLRVSTTSTAQCHGDTTGVWVAPRLTKAT
mgnify:CR=1 FL=1